MRNVLLLYAASFLSLTSGLDLSDLQIGYYLNVSALSELDHIGPYRCARECGKAADCSSFNYDRSNLKCQLLMIMTNATTNPEDFISNGAYIYGESATVISVASLMGTCTDVECQTGHTCVLLRTGPARCVLTGCGEPPAVGNAVVSKGGGYSIGEEKSYLCEYPSVANGPTTILCQTRGLWKSTSLVCEPPCVVTTLTQSNAQTDLTSAVFGSYVTYTCSSGYEQSGTGIQTCLSGGVWSTVDISCTIVDD